MKLDFTRGVFNIFNLKLNNGEILKYVGIAVRILIIFIIAKLAIRVLSTLIEKFFIRQKNSRFGMGERKADTLSELLKSILRYITYFVAIMWIFEAVGFDIKTVIAVTSILGVAIGFGAQSLVKDVISGFFILFEDQFAVGDYIVVEDKSGLVETLGLRITKIRDFSGDLHIIPNGSISKVTNKSRGDMRALVDVNIPYEVDIDRAVEIIREVNVNMEKEFGDIVDGPRVLGVTNLGEYGVTIRVVAKTKPMQQWDVEMELRKRIKHALDNEGIEIPYPKRVLLDKRKEG